LKHFSPLRTTDAYIITYLSKIRNRFLKNFFNFFQLFFDFFAFEKAVFKPLVKPTKTAPLFLFKLPYPRKIEGGLEFFAAEV